MDARISGERPLRRYPRVVQVPKPALGADWSTTVPAGKTWGIRLARATLTCSAAAATRVPSLDLSDGTTTFAAIPPVETLVASDVASLTWLESVSYVLNVTPSKYLVQPIPALTLWPGYTIASLTTALDAGDQWSGVVLYVIETMIGAGPIDLNTVPEMVVLTMPAGGGGGAIT